MLDFHHRGTILEALQNMAGTGNFVGEIRRDAFAEWDDPDGYRLE